MHIRQLSLGALFLSTAAIYFAGKGSAAGTDNSKLYKVLPQNPKVAIGLTVSGEFVMPLGYTAGTVGFTCPGPGGGGQMGITYVYTHNDPYHTYYQYMVADRQQDPPAKGTICTAPIVFNSPNGDVQGTVVMHAHQK